MKGEVHSNKGEVHSNEGEEYSSFFWQVARDFLESNAAPFCSLYGTLFPITGAGRCAG